MDKQDAGIMGLEGEVEGEVEEAQGLLRPEVEHYITSL